MPKSELPRFIIIAGANGSGKSTFAQAFLPAIGITEFLNADDMARGLSPFNPETKKLEAGRLVIRRRQNLIARRHSFALETALSGKTLIQDIQKARSAGYHIDLYYFHTTDPSLNIKRIAQRVVEGGHDVPNADVLRRH